MPIPLQILFIGDSKSEVELICRQLTNAGYAVTHERVETAESLKTAIDRIYWDIIISELTLPGLSAASALEALQKSGRAIPFIIVSDEIPEEMTMELSRSGLSDYLTKDNLNPRLTLVVRRELKVTQLQRERDETRAEMQKSHDWFNLVLETTSDSMFLLAVESNRSYRCLRVNSAYLKSTGFSEDQVVGKRAEELLSPQIAQDVLHKYEEAVRVGHTIQYEETAYLPQGMVMVETTLTPIVDQNGRCTHLLGSSHETTDALTKSEQHYRSLFDYASIAIWELDLSDVGTRFSQLKASGVLDFKDYFDAHPYELVQYASKAKIKDINERSVTLLDARNKGDIYNNIVDCFTYETIQCFKNILIALFEGKTNIELEIPVRTFKKEELIVNSSFLVTPGCEVTLSRVSVYFKDITTRHQAERALKESRDQLEWLFDVLPVGISILDQDGKVVKSNPALEEILTITKEGLAREMYQKRRYFRPDGTVKPREEFASSRVEHGEKIVYHVETGVEKEDGSVIWTDVSAASCGFSDWFTVIATTDITRRVETEKKNQDLLEQLRRQNQEQEMIIQLTSHLRQALKSDEAQMILVEQAVEIFGADAAALILDSGGTFRVSACSEKWKPWLGVTLTKSLDTFREILSSGHPRLLVAQEDLGKTLEYQQPGDFPITDMVSCALVPIHSENAPIGLLVLGNYSGKNSLDIKTNLLATVAEIAGITIQRMTTMESTEQLVSRRTAELTALFNVISSASQSKGLKDNLNTALEEVLHSLKCRDCGVFLYDRNKNQLNPIAGRDLPPQMQEVVENSPLETTWEGWVILNDEVLIVPDISTDQRFILPKYIMADQRQSYIGMPIRNQERILGVLSIIRVGEDIFSIDEITFISALANHIGVIIENNNLIEQAERAALMEERSRLARELHDSVTQTLYSAAFFADGGKKTLEQGNLDQTKECLTRLSQISRQALKEMRLLIYQLRPEILKDEGLVPALRQRLELVENKLSIQTQLSVNQVCRLSDKVEDTLYWTTIEALNNIMKHAQASQILVQIQIEDDYTILTVQDNGKGFDPVEIPQFTGLGLNNIRERLTRVGGTLEISSEKEKGTTLTAVCPSEK